MNLINNFILIVCCITTAAFFQSVKGIFTCHSAKNDDRLRIIPQDIPLEIKTKFQPINGKAK